jgi:hypothetical protein
LSEDATENATKILPSDFFNTIGRQRPFSACAPLFVSRSIRA